MYAGSGKPVGQTFKQGVVNPTRLLAEWAPLLLRALSEREVRHSYCPASLWLAPYHASFGDAKNNSSNRGGKGSSSGVSTQGEAFSAAGVVRALLARAGGIAGDAEGGSALQPQQPQLR